MEKSAEPQGPIGYACAAGEEVCDCGPCCETKVRLQAPEGYEGAGPVYKRLRNANKENLCATKFNCIMHSAGQSFVHARQCRS